MINDDKYIKTKLIAYEDSLITNFYNKNESKKIPEEKSTTQIFINNNFRFYHLCI